MNKRIKVKRKGPEPAEASQKTRIREPVEHEEEHTKASTKESQQRKHKIESQLNFYMEIIYDYGIFGGIYGDGPRQL